MDSAQQLASFGWDIDKLMNEERQYQSQLAGAAPPAQQPMQMTLAFRPAPRRPPPPVLKSPLDNVPEDIRKLVKLLIGYRPGIVEPEQPSDAQSSHLVPGASLQAPIQVEHPRFGQILDDLKRHELRQQGSTAETRIKIENTEDDDEYTPSLSLGFDSQYIKQEDPSDELPAGSQDTTAVQPNFAQSASLPSARPERPLANGTAPPTTCHNALHLVDQVHHHRLNCGHEIFTNKPQPCGMNCEVPRGRQAPAQEAFMCPDVGCQRQWKRQEKKEQIAFATKNGRRDRKPGRACFRSETEGASALAAAQRNTEVVRMREELQGRAPQRKRKVAADRGRSRSPQRGIKKAKSKHRERSLVETEMLDAHTAALLEANRNPQPLVKSKKSPEAHRLPDHIAEQEKPWSANGNRAVTGSARYAYDSGYVHEWSMPENRVNDAYREGNAGFTQGDVVPAMQDLKDWDVDVQQTYCVCEVPSDGYMLACAGCGMFFHPSCVGKQTQALVEYEGADSREAKEKDRQYWSDSGKFTCKYCDRRRAAKRKTLTWGEEMAESKRFAHEFRRIDDTGSDDERKSSGVLSGLVCDGCNERIIDTFFQCQLCPAGEHIGFCELCSKVPKMTATHNHKSAPGPEKIRAKKKPTAKSGADVMMTG